MLKGGKCSRDCSLLVTTCNVLYAAVPFEISHPRSGGAQRRRCKSWNKKCWPVRTQQRTLKEPLEKLSCNPQKERRRYNLCAALFLSCFDHSCPDLYRTILLNTMLCYAMEPNILYNAIPLKIEVFQSISIFCYDMPCYVIQFSILYYVVLLYMRVFYTMLFKISQYFILCHNISPFCQLYIRKEISIDCRLSELHLM